MNLYASGGDIFSQKKDDQVQPPLVTKVPQGAFSWRGHRRPRLYRPTDVSEICKKFPNSFGKNISSPKANFGAKPQTEHRLARQRLIF